MIAAFKQLINEKNLCKLGQRILIAVSGGVDSVVLLDLFAKSGFNISIAHCNFNLRGEESAGDEMFVKGLAEAYQVDLFVKSFDTKDYAKQNSLSVQEAARNIRYKWFDELSVEKGFDRIALAHHKDDVTESFFINLIRGSGLKGLKGIPVKRGKIIRPLFFASKEEIEKYAMNNALDFKEDSSNKSDKYLRNRIRHQLIPEFMQADRRGLEGIEKSISFLQEDYLVLTQLIDEKRKEMIIRNDEFLTIRIDDLLTLQPVETWSYYLLFPFGFNRDVTDSIAVSSEKKESGKIFYSGTHELLVDRDHLLIRDIKQNRFSEEVLIQKSDKDIAFPVELKISLLDNDQFDGPYNDPGTAWFDLDKLTFPLKIRPWLAGDRFKPFGMQGNKLVSDYLTDEKVNLFDKEKVLVLLSGKEIVWIVGYRSSEDFKVEKNTEMIYRLQLLI